MGLEQPAINLPPSGWSVRTVALVSCGTSKDTPIAAGDSSPSRRWSRDLGARLIRELSGHTAVGHLRLNINDVVQGDQIVLEGVEASEATELAGALQRPSTPPTGRA